MGKHLGFAVTDKPAAALRGEGGYRHCGDDVKPQWAQHQMPDLPAGAARDQLHLDR